MSGLRTKKESAVHNPLEKVANYDLLHFGRMGKIHESRKVCAAKYAAYTECKSLDPRKCVLCEHSSEISNNSKQPKV